LSFLGLHCSRDPIEAGFCGRSDRRENRQSAMSVPDRYGPPCRSVSRRAATQARPVTKLALLTVVEPQQGHRPKRVAPLARAAPVTASF